MAKRRPKVLVVTNGYPNPYKPYAAMYLQRHVQLHREDGVDVMLLTTDDSRRGIIRSRIKYLGLVWRALYHLLFTDYDLVHAHWPIPSGIIGALLSGIRRKPFILTLHGAYSNDFETRSRLTQAIVRQIVARATAVIAVGEEHSKKVKQIFCLPDSKLHNIDMGVWLPHRLISKNEARQRLGVDPNQSVLVFIGNLERNKGVDVLLHALPSLLQESREFTVYIGGQGLEEANLRKLLEELGLQQRVTLIGPVLPDDVPWWFSASDICVVPSRAESFGLIAVEAMACKTPVIAAAVGGLRQTVRHGENGLMFPPEDSVELTNQIRMLLSNKEYHSRLAEAGLQTAAQYDMREKAKRVLSIYQELMQRQV
jgi:D-inositol-3-phosphate glycosyltransferase